MSRGNNISSPSETLSPFAWKFAFDVRDEEVENFRALPGFHSLNSCTEWLKFHISDGERGISFKKALAYGAYRLLSYSCIPTILNLISTVVSGILAILTLPTRLCGEGLNRWFWVRFQGSLGYTLQSILVDLTCDARKVTGSCCCEENSLWVRI